MRSSDETNKIKLNAGLALRQKTDLLWANISANKISLPQGHSSGPEDG